MFGYKQPRWAKGLVIAGAGFIVGLLVAHIPASRADKPLSAFDFFDILVDLRSIVSTNYVEPVADDKLLKGAIDGMLGELDPYSNYFSREEWIAFEKQTRGQFTGIGAELSEDPTTGHITVVSPLEDSPALKAGIMAGDRFLSINGVNLDGKSLRDIITDIGGPPGTKLNVKVIRSGEKAPLNIEIERGVVAIQTVRGVKHRDDGSGTWDFVLDPEHRIGYARINSFSNNTSNELDRLLLPLLEGPNALKGLILDLRFNPGGLLVEGCAVADRFLSEGVIVSTRGRQPSSISVTNATPKDDYPVIPMVVLVNEYSASAAEIVAGALKDHHRAVLVGNRTYGKGSVQTMIAFNNGQSALKLTTANYYLPSGKHITRRKDAKEWGVDPHPGQSVEITEVENRAILRARAQSDIIMPKTTTQPVSTQPASTQPTTQNVVDRQLQQALNLLLEQKTAGILETARTTPAIQTTQPEVGASMPATTTSQPATEPRP
ncbi:MAG: S41 family peptidase [Phycisphaerae bacterium]